MKKINLLTLSILFFITANIAFSARFIGRRDRKIMRSQLVQNNNFEHKKFAIKTLSKLQDPVALPVLINELCFPSYNLGATHTQSGKLDLIRYKIAIALRHYKSFKPKKLHSYFFSMRSVIESDKVTNVVGQTAITAAIWIKKWKDVYKKLFVVSILRRLMKINKFNLKLVYQLVTSLKTINSDHGYSLLNKMLSMGFSNKVNNKIKKILRSRR